MQNFINELSNYLENSIKNNLSYGDKEVPIIEDILSKNKVTTANNNSIRCNFEDVILKYAKQNNRDLMYFVKDSKKTYWSNNKKHYNNDVFVVMKVENNKIEEIEISKNNMPQNIGVNDVFIIENNKYVLEEASTKELKDKIENMAKEIIDKQNEKLSICRKEEHLYMVTEELGNNRFLCDLTDTSKFEFEEVDIPKDVLEKATEGAVLRFANGTYEYYSNDGFERIEKIYSSK